MSAIIAGIATVIAGCYGLLHWRMDLIHVLKGILPLSFVCGGVVSIFAGISSRKK